MCPVNFQSFIRHKSHNYKTFKFILKEKKTQTTSNLVYMAVTVHTVKEQYFERKKEWHNVYMKKLKYDWTEVWLKEV